MAAAPIAAAGFAEVGQPLVAVAVVLLVAVTVGRAAEGTEYRRVQGKQVDTEQVVIKGHAVAAKGREGRAAARVRTCGMGLDTSHVPGSPTSGARCVCCYADGGEAARFRQAHSSVR